MDNSLDQRLAMLEELGNLQRVIAHCSEHRVPDADWHAGRAILWWLLGQLEDEDTFGDIPKQLNGYPQVAAYLAKPEDRLMTRLLEAFILHTDSGMERYADFAIYCVLEANGMTEALLAQGIKDPAFRTRLAEFATLGFTLVFDTEVLNIDFEPEMDPLLPFRHFIADPKKIVADAINAWENDGSPHYDPKDAESWQSCCSERYAKALQCMVTITDDREFVSKKFAVAFLKEEKETYDHVAEKAGLIRYEKPPVEKSAKAEQDKMETFRDILTDYDPKDGVAKILALPAKKHPDLAAAIVVFLDLPNSMGELHQMRDILKHLRDEPAATKLVVQIAQAVNKEFLRIFRAGDYYSLKKFLVPVRTYLDTATPEVSTFLELAGSDTP